MEPSRSLPVRIVAKAYDLRHLVLAIATALVVLALPPLLGPEDIQLGERNANATCSGMSLTSTSKAVRPNGRVTIQGRVCDGGVPTSGETVSVRLRAKRSAAQLASAQTDGEGQFSVCPRVRVKGRTRLARLTALDETGASASTTIRVSRNGPNGCNAPQPEPAAEEPDPSTTYVAPPTDPPEDPTCPLSTPGSTVGLELPASCTVVAQDDADSADPLPFWGKIDCQDSSRHQRLTSGGDSRPTGVGASQGNSAFRRMTVQDGDNIWGERCELGLNESYAPNTLYHEGQRRVTFISLRLANGVDPLGYDWRTVAQMKQAQTYRNPDTSPIIELQVRGGEWILRNSWNDIWSAPAKANTWTRIAFDIVYSADPSVGTMRLYVDANGDGDASDPGESSPTIHVATLRRETAGSGSSRYEVGESIPDHLRAGIYQNQAYSCPTGCSVDVDNVQVVR